MNDDRAIETDVEHAAELARVEAVFAAQPGTPAFDELTTLVRRIDEYESKTCLMGNEVRPTPPAPPPAPR